MKCVCCEVILTNNSHVILGCLLSFSINISSANFFSGMGMKTPKLFIDLLGIDGRF